MYSWNETEYIRNLQKIHKTLCNYCTLDSPTYEQCEECLKSYYEEHKE